jgi:hypothetical protein
VYKMRLILSPASLLVTKSNPRFVAHSVAGVDELEVTINCLGDERGCQFECGRIYPSGSGGASMRPYSTVVLSLISLICI